jgi:DNA-binding XRE family transcriptional regulator
VIVIIVIVVERSQDVSEGPVRRARPLPPCYFVRGAEVDALIDADVHHIVSHIRKATRIDLAPIGRRIRELRGFDMTQAEFARGVPVAQSYLSALERGEKEPGAAVLLAISKEFGKSVDWLLTGKAFVEPKKSSPK